MKRLGSANQGVAPQRHADIGPCATRAALAIGEWQVDSTAHELMRGNQAVRVEPKVMQVLLQLAASAGSVVTRDELLATVWADVVVGDEALTQTIIKLRRALGDNPRAPAYIETIAKRGYRLVAPVVVATGPVEPGAALPSTTRAQRWPLSRGWLVAATLTLALGIGAKTDLAPAGPASLPASATDSGADATTIGVVPFESLGAGSEHAYLARGISNDLMTDLSRLAGLRVVRASGLSEPSSNARYVVTGSVQREADALRVNVRLLDQQTKQQLWSERFERAFGDLFAVQSEISQGIVDVLPGKLQEAAKRSSAQRYTRNLAAYDHFLRGQSQFLLRQAHENDAARDSYRKAIELDPGFARAYAGLAMTYALDPRLRSSPDAAPALARALQLAESAREIDPSIPEVHWAIGFIQTQQRHYDKAMESLKRAVALNPSYADAYALMAGIHTYVGEPAKSIPLMRTALRLDPGGGYLYYMVLGRAYFFQGDTEQALINLREAAARNPVDVETRVFLAGALLSAKDARAAEWEAQEIRALDPRFSLQQWLQSYPLSDARERTRLIALLQPVGL